MNKLIELYNINSPSMLEQDMQFYITVELSKIRNVRFYSDKIGNIYAIKGKSKRYPCIVSHMDEVHSINPNKKVIYGEDDDMIFGFDFVKNDFTGIGVDDKNGIWICLKALEILPTLKCVFFVGEEIGCVGSSKVSMNFFNNCRYVIQCDKRNGGDFVTSTGFTELCDKEFYHACTPEKFGYKEATGIMTDVMILKQKGLNVACCNLSCGYYKPHCKDEYTLIPELENCLNFVLHICNTVPRHSHQHISYKTYFEDNYYTNYISDYYNKYFDDFKNFKI